MNHSQGSNFSEIHEVINFHFDQVELEGLDYFILERDRNNPHEGFGFMALNGAVLKKNQDSIKAYLKTLLSVQTEILSKLNKTQLNQEEKRIEDIFINNLNPSDE